MSRGEVETTVGRESPSPAAIEAERRRAGLTQSAAAALVQGSLRGWQQWEAGDRKMHPGLWELFLLKTGRLSEEATQGGDRDSGPKRAD
jgi:DNA-binding transcriptional regulator YiaG